MVKPLIQPILISGGFDHFVDTKVLKPRPFKELGKEEVQGFQGRTSVRPKSNRDDVKINLILIKIQINVLNV